jgi:hypothetical protein
MQPESSTLNSPAFAVFPATAWHSSRVKADICGLDVSDPLPYAHCSKAHQPFPDIASFPDTDHG